MMTAGTTWPSACPTKTWTRARHQSGRRGGTLRVGDGAHGGRKPALVPGHAGHPRRGEEGDNLGVAVHVADFDGTGAADLAAGVFSENVGRQSTCGSGQRVSTGKWESASFRREPSSGRRTRLASPTRRRRATFSASLCPPRRGSTDSSSSSPSRSNSSVIVPEPVRRDCPHFLRLRRAQAASSF